MQGGPRRSILIGRGRGSLSPKGVHFIVEASGCGEVITDVVRLQDILVEAAKQANAQVWSVSFNRFPPNLKHLEVMLTALSH